MWSAFTRREEPQALQTPTPAPDGRSKKAKGRNVDMYVCGSWDMPRSTNEAANKADGYALAAVIRRRRTPTRRNGPQVDSRRTESRGDASHRGCGAYDKPIEGVGFSHINLM